MSVRRGVLTLVMVVLVLAPTISAQAKSTALSLAQVQAQRRAIIEATVAPSPQQAEEFWHTYWLYRGQVSMLTDRLVALIEEYGASEASLTDDRATAMVQEILDIQAQRAELREEYVKKFQKILLPKQVVRWYQTESKLDAVVQAAIAASIPFDE